MHKSTFAVSLLVLLHLFAARVDAQGWVDVSDPNNTPGGTNNAAMCYYAPGGYCLLVNGDQTWTHTANGWTQLTPTTTPSTSTTLPWNGDQHLVSDPATGICLLAKSYTNLTYLVNIYTWLWDGQDWSSGPSAILSQPLNNDPNDRKLNLSYDTQNNQIILVWGNGNFTTQTYRIHLSTPTNPGFFQVLNPLVRPVIEQASQKRMFYDAISARVTLVVQDPPGLWQYDSTIGNWSQCFPSYLGHPITSGDFGRIAFSDNNNVGIGLGVDLPYTTRTLEYSGCEIGIQFLPTQPAVRTGYSIAYDSSRSRFVLHGGSNYADTWELELGPLASYTTTGTGCPGTGGTPTLQAANGSLPVAGSQFNVQVSGMPWNTPAFMFMGTSNTSYGGAPLPFDLAPIGAPGCVLRAPGTYLFGVPNVLGTGLWNYSIPYLPGQVFYNQAIIFDPAANSLGLTVSNVGEAVIGS
jgi:hypothetical protein